MGILRIPLLLSDTVCIFRKGGKATPSILFKLAISDPPVCHTWMQSAIRGLGLRHAIHYDRLSARGRSQIHEPVPPHQIQHFKLP